MGRKVQKIGPVRFRKLFEGDEAFREALCTCVYFVHLGYQVEEIHCEPIGNRLRVSLSHVDRVFWIDLKAPQVDSEVYLYALRNPSKLPDSVEETRKLVRGTWIWKNQDYVQGRLEDCGMYPPRQIGLA